MESHIKTANCSLSGLHLVKISVKKILNPRLQLQKRTPPLNLKTDGNREHFHGDAEFMFFNFTVFVLACILFMEENGEYVMH